MDNARSYEWKPLRAGPLQMHYEQGGLRYIKFGEREILRRIYGAVRDRNWETVPADVSVLEFDADDRRFRIVFESEHREREIDFVWRGEITGDDEGFIRFIFDGRARSGFLRNRIGLCVLHPAELAGAACRLRYANGSRYTTVFPDLVAAQQPVAAIHDLGSITHEVSQGLWAEVTFGGDLFEMEDQRNWIDASYKTYCTPLRLPFPLEITEGTRIQQSVELRLLRTAPINAASDTPVELSAAPADEQQTVEIVVGKKRHALAPIGLGLGRHPLSMREIECLYKLKPAHLRVDLNTAEYSSPGAMEAEIARASEVAMQLAAQLEIALFPGGNPEAEMNALQASIDAIHPPIARWIVFDANAKSSTARCLKPARRMLEIYGAPIGGGTNADFYQLNQFRPPAELMDFVAFSINPQSHAFDDASLVETLTAIPYPVCSAQHYFNNLPVVISPVTLKPRFNPVAAGAQDATPPGCLPPQVDVRQMTAFGAAWTLGALKRLIQSSASSITLYETTGWCGVMETESGSPLPEKFPSRSGEVFPLYHVLADVARFAGGSTIEVLSNDPLRAEAMLLEYGGERRLLLANLTPEALTVTLREEENAERRNENNVHNRKDVVLSAYSVISVPFPSQAP